MVQTDGFFSRNKGIILLFFVLLLGFFALSTIKENYHKKEVKALQAQIKERELDFGKAMVEKKQLQDSSAYYELLAMEAGIQAQYFKNQVFKLQDEKNALLRTLASIPKEVIDSFLARRYSNVPKSKVDLQIDKNVGNAIVIELTEKDLLVKELDLKYSENNALDSQVTSLKTSLDYSKGALVQADSAIAIKTEQLELSQDSNKLLEKDLKVAKRKAFWNKWKGGGVGTIVGFLAGLILL